MIEGHDPQQAEDHARSVLGAQQYATAAETAKHRSLDEILTLATTTPAFKSTPSS
jgi:hypothetical protein